LYSLPKSRELLRAEAVGVLEDVVDGQLPPFWMASMHAVVVVGGFDRRPVEPTLQGARANAAKWRRRKRRFHGGPPGERRTQN
jgi:hypothetical protein